MDKIRGLDISITTTARNDEEALALLQAFNFPIKEKSIQELEEPVEAAEEENKEDKFLIKFYCKYMDKTIIELLSKIDDNNSAIIRRGFKLLEKWDKGYTFPIYK